MSLLTRLVTLQAMRRALGVAAATCTLALGLVSCGGGTSQVETSPVPSQLTAGSTR